MVLLQHLLPAVQSDKATCSKDSSLTHSSSYHLSENASLLNIFLGANYKTSNRTAQALTYAHGQKVKVFHHFVHFEAQENGRVP